MAIEDAVKKRFDFVYDEIARVLEAHQFPLPALLDRAGAIVDYGCGIGEAALRFALQHPDREVRGQDINSAFDRLGELAQRALAVDAGRVANLGFENLGTNSGDFAISETADRMRFDSNVAASSVQFCYSWCVLEHVRQELLDGVFQHIFRQLQPGGYFYVKINPLFYSARGHHFHHVIPQNWVHLSFQHDRLEEEFYRSGRERKVSNLDAVWRQYETLNKMTVGSLRASLEAAGFEHCFEERTYEGNPGPELEEVFSREVLTCKDIVMLGKKPG